MSIMLYLEIWRDWPVEPQERWEQWTLRGKASRYPEGRGNRPEPTLRVRMGVGALATCLFPPSIPGHLAN